MSPARVLELPVELFVEILKLLDSSELLLCSLVCRSFYDVIRRSLELQYRIELAADGMIDGPPDWTQKVEIPVPGACQAYELVGGVFAKSMSVGILPGSRHMISTWLPTRTNAAHTVVTEDLGVATRDFAIDTSRDLLVLVDADEMQGPALRVKVHLRTISKNTPHPRATQRELVAEIPFHIGSSFIQIVDDVVGMFFWVHGPGLIIWNWITGEELCIADRFNRALFVQRIRSSTPGRTAASVCNFNGLGTSTASVWFFRHCCPVGQLRPDMHDSQGKCRLLLEPTTLAAGMVFEEDVTTSLPYSLSLRTGTFNYSGYMLDDERLIGMKSMALADGDMTDIDVYTF
ncbi:hypothetical protein A0H81_06795 [Grifola frondosa]|uniref:F-box domain-containing protein n=1 Tax=Grifola frondosa TaxID=5627 RepID=A0A1C7MEP4_GRIFR|nr:hypothetical protein A0H81_06795 [Grifola frondosa]